MDTPKIHLDSLIGELQRLSFAGAKRIEAGKKANEELWKALGIPSSSTATAWTLYGIPISISTNMIPEWVAVYPNEKFVSQELCLWSGTIWQLGELKDPLEAALLDRMRTLTK